MKSIGFPIKTAIELFRFDSTADTERRGDTIGITRTRHPEFIELWLKLFNQF